jgi:hypothetical protein
VNNHKPGPGRPLGSPDKVITDKRRAANKRNAQAPRARSGPNQYDEATKKRINDARSRGAWALPDVIDDIVRVARLGYTRYEDPLTGAFEFVRVEPETRLYAARYIGDRCGLPPRAETEIGAAEGMPLTLIVMGEDVKE